MVDPFVDTNILIRFLANDDPAKQARATALLERIERRELSVVVPVVVIAEAVYVLSSPRLYHLSRQQVFEMLAPLVRLPNFRVQNRRLVMKALDLFLSTQLDFEDAYIVASMAQAGSRELYSFDEDFDRIQGLRRIEP